MSFIDDLRNKSDGTKKQIAFWTAAFIVVFVGLVWSTTLPARFAEVKPAIAESPKQEDGGFGKFLFGMWNTIKSQGASLIETMKPEPQEDTGPAEEQHVAISEEVPPVEESQGEQQENMMIATSTNDEAGAEHTFILIGTSSRQNAQ